LNTGSVATSGNSERAIAVDGTGYGHLLDPRTGDPAPDWGAVTVVASDPVAADCLSTALYVMGADEAAEWLRQRPGIEAVFVERDKETVRVTVTPGFRGRLEAIEGELKYLTARDEWTELHDTKTDARQLAADGERR
jgi:thiamine biosynthesis lipoprotein